MQKTLTNGEEIVDIVDDKDQVRDRLNKLRQERDKLNVLWASKDRLLTERLEFQLFMRLADQLDNWIRKQEAFLSSNNLGIYTILRVVNCYLIIK